MKYTVIIPAYNAEKTLERCLSSIFNQNRDDVEVIIINDGSTDHTHLVCDVYKSKFDNIFLINKDNEGVAIARNIGIQHSSGEYIIFVDSDDYICNGLFGILDSLLDEYPYDYIALSYKSRVGQRVTLNSKYDFKALDRKSTQKKVSEMIANKGINSPWAKLYKNSIIKEHDINFTPHVSIAEDRAFNIKYAMYIETMRISSFPGYVVTLDNENSLSRGAKKELQQQLLLAERDLKKEFSRCSLTKKEKLIIKKSLDFCEYLEIYSEVKRMYQSGVHRKERRSHIKVLCKKANKKNLIISFSIYRLMLIIPIKLKNVTIIDFVGYVLAYKNMGDIGLNIIK